MSINKMEIVELFMLSLIVIFVWIPLIIRYLNAGGGIFGYIAWFEELEKEKKRKEETEKIKKERKRRKEV